MRSHAPTSDSASLPTARGDGSILFAPLARSVEAALAGFGTVEPERRNVLDRLATFVRERGESPAALTFICTHNSRRSHLAELWAAAAAAYYRLDGVQTYSGGTEATAFHPNAIAALERAGFVITTLEGANPRHQVRFGPGAEPRVAFSKVFSTPPNPADGFAAVMTCSEADRGCPVVRGATLRVALPYRDPKEADGTAAEAERYDERSQQIATEMLYLMARVAEARERS